MKKIVANEETICKNCGNIVRLSVETIRCPKCESRSLAFKSDYRKESWKIALENN